jgi:hypothetical protein
VDRRDPEYSNILRIGSGSHSNLKFARNYRNVNPFEGFRSDPFGCAIGPNIFHSRLQSYSIESAKFHMYYLFFTNPKKEKEKLFPLKAQLCGSVGRIGSDRRSRKCKWIGMRNQIRFRKRIWIWNAIQKNRIGQKPVWG